MSLRQLATASCHPKPSLVTQGSSQYPSLLKTQGSAGEHPSAQLYKPVCVMIPVKRSEARVTTVAASLFRGCKFGYLVILLHILP